MSRNKYYILYPSESTPYTSEIYFTTNPIIFNQFIRQNEIVDYDVIEMYGDDIFDISEKLMKKYHKAIDTNDKLIVFETHIPGISFISSESQMFDGYDIYPLIREINQLFIEKWHKLKILLPYVSEPYKESLKLFTLLLYKYICRQVIACECDLNNVSFESKELLDFCPFPDGYIDIGDVIDENLMLYVLEYGWDGMEGVTK